LHGVATPHYAALRRLFWHSLNKNLSAFTKAVKITVYQKISPTVYDLAAQGSKLKI
jgi:hypothetical protein